MDDSYLHAMKNTSRKIVKTSKKMTHSKHDKILFWKWFLLHTVNVIGYFLFYDILALWMLLSIKEMCILSKNMQ